MIRGKISRNCRVDECGGTHEDDAVIRKHDGGLKMSRNPSSYTVRLAEVACHILLFDT